MDNVTAQQIQSMLGQANSVDTQGPLYDKYTAQALRRKAGILLGDESGATTGPIDPIPQKTNPNTTYAGMGLDTLTNFWHKLTSPSTYSNAYNEIAQLRNGMGAIKNRLPQPGGAPIAAPQTFADVWNSMKERLK